VHIVASSDHSPGHFVRPGASRHIWSVKILVQIDYFQKLWILRGLISELLIVDFQHLKWCPVLVDHYIHAVLRENLIFESITRTFRSGIIE